MSKFIGVIIGGAELAAGIAGEIIAPGNPLSTMSMFLVHHAAAMIIAGIGTTIAGLGTLLSKGPLSGMATTVRNPVAPWKVIYGRARTSGTII